MNQMTIFDVMASSMDFRKMTDEEMIRLIGEMTGLEFRWNDFFCRWIARDKALTVMVYRDTFDTNDDRNGKEFIALDVNYRKADFGIPCESISEAVNEIKNSKKRLKAEDR